MESPCLFTIELVRAFPQHSKVLDDFKCFVSMLFSNMVTDYRSFMFLLLYSIVSEIVYMQNCFIHEHELENDRGAVETSFLFFIARFYNKNYLFSVYVLKLDMLSRRRLG